VAQVVECLPSKGKALSSNSNITKKRKKTILNNNGDNIKEEIKILVEHLLCSKKM
jgi:hypothetical protein